MQQLSLLATMRLLLDAVRSQGTVQQSQLEVQKGMLLCFQQSVCGPLKTVEPKVLPERTVGAEGSGTVLDETVLGETVEDTGSGLSAEEGKDHVDTEIPEEKV